MIKIKIILIFFLILTNQTIAKDDFISDYEYGEMLYNNPRGISCTSCHGDYAQGKKIVEYHQTDGKRVIVKGSDIRDITLIKLHKSLKRNHKIMPRYYLANKEVIAIYKYIKEKNRRLRTPKVVIEDETTLIYHGDGLEKNIDYFK
jgi:hypothetical protein